VLFVDVLRPLPFPESAINRAIIKAIGYSPFVLDAKRNQEAWEKRFLQRRGAGARSDPNELIGRAVSRMVQLTRPGEEPSWQSSGLCARQWSRQSSTTAVNEKAGVDENPPEGLLIHTAGEVDGQWQIVDVWSPSQAAERFGPERLAPAIDSVMGGAPPGPPRPPSMSCIA